MNRATHTSGYAQTNGERLPSAAVTIARLHFRSMDSTEFLRAEAKRTRRALRRLVERYATRSGRALASTRLAAHEATRRCYPFPRTRS